MELPRNSRSIRGKLMKLPWNLRYQRVIRGSIDGTSMELQIPKSYQRFHWWNFQGTPDSKGLSEVPLMELPWNSRFQRVIRGSIDGTSMEPQIPKGIRGSIDGTSMELEIPKGYQRFHWWNSRFQGSSEVPLMELPLNYRFKGNFAELQWMRGCRNVWFFEENVDYYSW